MRNWRSCSFWTEGCDPGRLFADTRAYLCPYAGLERLLATTLRASATKAVGHDSAAAGVADADQRRYAGAVQTKKPLRWISRSTAFSAWKPDVQIR